MEHRAEFLLPGPSKSCPDRQIFLSGDNKNESEAIMRALRSFDPCLSCGVHMYPGKGKLLDTCREPMFGFMGHSPEEGTP